MKPATRAEIEDLADALGEVHFKRQKGVDLGALMREEVPPILLGYHHFDSHFDGTIRYYRGRFLVLINVRRGEEGGGRARFTVAHELGHYFIDHHRHCLEAGLSHASISDFRSRKRIEQEADAFAAALLMPRTKLEEALPKREPSINDIKRLTEEFRTSLTSTAIRVVKCSDFACAVASSTRSEVEWFIASDGWRDALGSGHNRPDAMPQLPDEGESQCERCVQACDWVDDARAAELPVWEETIPISIADRFLTFLSAREKDIERFDLLPEDY